MTAGESDAPRLVQYWHSDDVPGYVGELMATFRLHNPDMRHVVFDERTAERMIADRFGPRHAQAFRSCAVPAMQADYFRYCAVYAFGGIYVDATFAAERPLGALLDRDGQLFGSPSDGPFLNGLFAFRAPGHPFLRAAIEVATRNVERRLSQVVGLTTGPAIFSGLAQLARGRSLEVLRRTASPRMRPFLDACWDELADSLTGAVERVGPIDGALEGVALSTRAEMLTLVRKPELRAKREGQSGRHWAHWEGSIFREAESAA